MSILAFILAALALALTPGPGIAYVVARTVAGGRSEGLASCLGAGLGGLVHVAAAVVGLSLLIAQSALAFNLVKYLGTAYLVYLGIRMLMSKERPFEVGLIRSRGAQRAFMEGIMVETLNIKTALFFLAFLPQFTTSDAPLPPQLALLGCICVTLNTSVDVLAVFGTDRLLRYDAARASRERVLTRVSGCVMLTLAVFLAQAHRE